ncbi:MAG: threonine--tRNA ligase [Acidobacteriaceae bacterium]|nr:threonine--tRNA ligase [Acidobacteriaceae bacterium]
MAVIQKEGRDSFVYRERHSLAHVLAQAVQKNFPGVKLAFGPPIDDGFYYDFLLPRPLSEEDFPALEKDMRRIIAEGQQFVREDLPAAEALARIEQMDQPFKLEYARELISSRNLDSLSFYTNGPFVDLCEGPHVDNTRQLPPDAFALHNISGAYWRGDERNPMLTRVYGYAFPTAAELKSHVAAVALAKERDHRKLAAELGIYAISDQVGKGLPLWLPNGAAIRQELEKLAYEWEFKRGYKRVATPHIAHRSLYVTSGHIPLYEDAMFPPMEHAPQSVALTADSPEESFYLRPMNCPHHHMVFAAQPRSYRDLPLRLTEYGTVYRYERAGQLQGLTRVRGMSMNDAHLYVTPDQLKDELKAVMELHRDYYGLFGFTNYYLRLSMWDPNDPKRRSKYVEDPEAWTFSEAVLKEAVDELGLTYTIEKGEAAFYGPKVDFQFRSVIGREFTLSTNQLDFAVPSRFNLRYTAPDGSLQTPYVIHRAPLGTHERFIAFLLEHYGGAFPTWLAPVQVRIVPISDKFVSYARSIEDRLRDLLVRTELDAGSETTGKKIRNAAISKTPIVLVIGGREQEQSSVTVRRYGIEKQESMTLDAFVVMLTAEIGSRGHVKAV